MRLSDLCAPANQLTCRPMGPGGPGKPRAPSSPFCPNIPCWPLGPGSPSPPWGSERLCQLYDYRIIFFKQLLIVSKSSMCVHCFPLKNSVDVFISFTCFFLYYYKSPNHSTLMRHQHFDLDFDRFCHSVLSIEKHQAHFSLATSHPNFPK